MPFNKFKKNSFKRGRKNFQGNSGRKKPEKQELVHHLQLNDEEVGISQYISELEGYEGIIKARYSDFQVNEIDSEGVVAKLTDTSVPKEFCAKTQTLSFQDTEKSPIDEIPQDIWEALKKFVSESDAEPIILDAEHLTKDDRRKVHECIKSYFGQKIVPTTIKKDEKSIMEFKKPSKKGPERTEWPFGVPEYVHFIVHKELMDTMQACLKIAQALKMRPSNITYAGVKDRRAKTSQWFCIKKIQPWKLFAKIKGLRGLKIGNITFKDTPLALGDLKANRFRIALRNVKAEDDLINNSISHLREHGFINYYGLQRFGNDREVPTYLIGIKLLRSQWKEAINLILKVKAAEDPELTLTQAKQKYHETGSAEEALKLCDKTEHSLEFQLLQGLAKNGKNDYVNALENVPRNIRLMYIHSFQSLIFNKMASQRFLDFGMKPVIGDLVYAVNPENEDPFGSSDDIDEDSSSDSNKKTNQRPIVKALTSDDIDKYSVYDIVLPLPGYDVIYPEHMKKYYKEAIEEFGLELEMPKQSVKTYNLSGGYRKFLGKPENLEWKIMYYNDPTDNLIRSDLNELLGDAEPKSIENGKYKAVVLSFTLNSSCYATMVLRELLKCNTSSSVQALLNNYGDTKSNGDKPKVIMEVASNSEVKEEPEEILPGSLLANKDKYEDFKNKLFQDILSGTDGQESSKRSLEIDDEDANKKLKSV